MLGLRFAAEKLNQMDTAYAARLYDENKLIKSLTQEIPMSQVDRVIPTEAYEARGGIGPRDRRNTYIGKAVDAGLGVDNVASRYALPAGGVTLAGKALHDLSSNLFALSAEDAEQYAQTFEANGMPEYAAQMRASQVGTEGELPM